MRYLADENLDGTIIRGLIRRTADIDLVRVQDVGLRTADDAAVLEWAAAHGRVILTHDRRTMPWFAYQRISEGREIAGLIVIKSGIPVARVIEDILLRV